MYLIEGASAVHHHASVSCCHCSHPQARLAGNDLIAVTLTPFSPSLVTASFVLGLPGVLESVEPNLSISRSKMCSLPLLLFHHHL